MVDRIEKTKSSHYWKIDGGLDLKKDQEEQSSEKGQQENPSKFDEKTDWTRLISKDSVPRETVNLPLKSIQTLLFRGVSTWRDRASLEVDLILKDGTRTNSALLSISRSEGLKLVHVKPGQSLDLYLLGNAPQVRVGVVVQEKVNPPPVPLVMEKKSEFVIEEEKTQLLDLPADIRFGKLQLALFILGTLVLLFGGYWLVMLLMF